MSQASNSHDIKVVEERVKHEREMRARFEREVERRFKDLQRAIDLAAKTALRRLQERAEEVEKRLVNLNHEAKRLDEYAKGTVLADVWRQSEKSRDEWQRNIEKELASLRESRSGVTGRDEATERMESLMRQQVESTRAFQRWAIGLAVIILLALATSLLPIGG